MHDVKDKRYYSLNLNEIKVGDKVIDIPKPAVTPGFPYGKVLAVIDSGTSAIISGNYLIDLIN
jgi:hypothetical protein